MAVNPEFEDLANHAFADAGLERESVYILTIDATPDVDAGQQPVLYLPRGAAPQDEFPWTTERKAELARARQPHRLVVFGQVEDAALLGLLRWGLEAAVQYEQAPGAWTFSWTVLDAGLAAAHGGTPGSGVMHNVLPPVRDANLAAARLVNKTYGEQFGELFRRWGSLYREGHDFGGSSTLAARSVVLASAYKPWLDAQIPNHNTQRSLVAAADPDAAGWWETCTTDSTITGVSGVITLLQPSADELSAAGTAPAEPWRPLAHLIDRTQVYGLALLGVSSPGAE